VIATWATVRRRLELRRRFAIFWHEYTRMRTAIYFLIGIVLLVLVGSFVPQEFTSSQTKVDEFLAAHHSLNALGTAVGLPLTSVFVSPVFLILLGSLYVALGACVLRRGFALIRRTLRRHPRTPQYWGEWGSWLFHTSFFLLLIAVMYGKATGFEGIMTITEGQRMAEAPANFDTLQQGMFFDGRHAGYSVQLNSFRSPYLANGVPADFVSNVTVYDGNRPVITRDIRVNDFLGYKDVDFYQQDYGWAPRVVVRNPAGEVVSDGYTKFFSQMKNVSTGVLKIPGFGYRVTDKSAPIQLGVRMAVFPDAITRARVAADGSIDVTNVDYVPGGNEARNPVLQLQLFVGDLGLNNGAAQNVNELVTTKMQPYFVGGKPIALPMKQKLDLPLPAADGKTVNFTVEFPELRQYSLFHVKKDNGVPFVYTAFTMTMVGMLSKLYLRPLLEGRRRRVRARATAGDNPAAEPGDTPPREE